MKVFISWSGEPSKQVAELFQAWIEEVLQGVQAWISSADIDKGALWFGDIAAQLEETGVGVLCLTRENINAPWILFEAGALSKGLSKNRVCPLLVNLTHAEVRPPLSQFNATLPTKEEMLKLVKTINSQNAGDKRLPDERAQKSFERCWSEFETKFQSIITSYKPGISTPRRSTEEMLVEILEVTRSMQNSMQQTRKTPLYRVSPSSPSLPDDAFLSTDAFAAAVSGVVEQKKKEWQLHEAMKELFSTNSEFLQAVKKEEKLPKAEGP